MVFLFKNLNPFSLKSILQLEVKNANFNTSLCYYLKLVFHILSAQFLCWLFGLLHLWPKLSAKNICFLTKSMFSQFLNLSIDVIVQFITVKTVKLLNWMVAPPMKKKLGYTSGFTIDVLQSMVLENFSQKGIDLFLYITNKFRTSFDRHLIIYVELFLLFRTF